MKLFILLVVLPSILIASPAKEEFCENSETLVELARKNNKTNSSLLSGLKRIQADCYIKGIGVERDVGKGKSLLSEAHEMGDKQAGHILANLKVFRSNSKEEQKEGLELLKKEYQIGSKFSAGKLGWAYNAGLGAKKDEEKAFEYYKIAAEGGMTLWQYLLAHIYEEGYYGKKPDIQQVEYWKSYRPKVHVYTYECAVAQLYSGKVSFPENPEIENKFVGLCKRKTANQ
jgi:TPR repeat protein